MLATNSITVLFFMIIYVADCQRRIKDGQEVTVDRKYAVYLVKAPKSDKGYDSWLCGGAIVSNQFVVTSAACVNDVDFLYVIAGYKKYIPDSEIETDQCTSTMKKKVIYTCSPKGYEMKYGELDYWSNIDIALVRIESPFDFDDPAYETSCSYKPVSISINYDERYQDPGTDALVLGWGHTKDWRKPGDTNNYNQQVLRYAPTLLLNKTICIEHYEDYMNMSLVIQNYMICSLGKGNIDDTGNTILQSLPKQKGCTSQQEKLLGFEGISCEDRSSEDSYEDRTRRHYQGSNQINNVTSKDLNETRARRSGICQNDHGGPLVTWAGAREILIGVASVFKVSNEYECMGPYLYTSTMCTGLFLDCILQSEFPSKRSDSGRRYLCDRPPSERGYDTIERIISWKDHPAGPAKNEIIERSGPKPKLSEGLKYLTKYLNYEPQQPGYAESNAPKESFKTIDRYPSNKSISGVDRFPVNGRQQERTKYEFNKMYVANNNPAIVRNVHKERFVVQDRYPEIIPEKKNSANNRYPISQTGKNQEESNKKYAADINPEVTNYAHKERFKIKGRNPENKSILGRESVPVNNGNPLNPILGRYAVYKSNPGNATYPAAAVRNPALRSPANGRYPASVGSSSNHQMAPAKISLRLQRPLRI